MARIRKVTRRRVARITRRIQHSSPAETPSEHQEPLADVSRASRVVVIGDRIFNVKLKKLVEAETDFKVVATADSPRDAVAVVNENRADLAVVDVNFGGPGQGAALARDLGERSPGCGFLIVCSSFTQTVTRSLWVYRSDSWSIITQATAQSPAHFAEVVSSAVHGIPWVEPGVQREMRKIGSRPASLDERRWLTSDEGGSLLAA